MVAADLDGDGRDELLVVNTRQSRLDWYRWLPADQRTPPAPSDPDRPNELPLAPDWNKSELALDELPLDLVVADLDADGRPELVLLTSPSNKAVVYKREAPDKWQKSTSWDLLSGTPTGRELLLLRQPVAGKFELLISFEQGIQTLRLEPGSRPNWLTPREVRGRLAWELLDIDGDGDQDLLEWSPLPRQTIRWYDCQEGKLLPAQVLFDQSVQGLETLSLAGQPAELVLLGGAQEGLLRRYTLARAAEQDLGRQQSLPMPGGAGTAWCGLNVGDRPALVAVDPVQPRLRVQALGEAGWQAEESFPSIGGVRAVAAPQAKPGTLLLWAKDAADLHVSHWDSGRLSYPKPLPQSAEVSDRRILALESVGATTWWAQRVGSDVDLYVWQPGQEAARATRFTGLGSKEENQRKVEVEKVVWLGGQAILVRDSFANSNKLAQVRDGQVTVSEPAHLAKVEMSELELVSRGGELRPARLTDGVLQWLGDDFQPLDQVMLTDGQRLAGFVALPDGQAWALEQGGAFLHRLQPDEAGILRVADSKRLAGGTNITLDPLLGLMLVDQDRVVRLSRGQPWELKLLDSLDSRVGRPSGVKEATIHRFLTTDVTADGVDEVLLCDDLRHQLTALERTAEGLKSLLSWPVFEDQTYPYGGEQGSQVSEPRAVVGLDADGDSHQDLALLCHDRLIIYMARETQ